MNELHKSSSFFSLDFPSDRDRMIAVTRDSHILNVFNFHSFYFILTYSLRLNTVIIDKSYLKFIKDTGDSL